MIPTYETPLRNTRPNDLPAFPSKTFKIDWENNRLLSKRIDREEALEQAVQVITAIEYQDFEVMPDWFGIEMKEMYGKPRRFVKANLERIIKEACSTDLRIKRLSDFWMEDLKEAVVVHFTIECEEGAFNTQVRFEDA